MFADISPREFKGAILSLPEVLADSNLSVTPPYYPYYLAFMSEGQMICIPFTGKGTIAKMRWVDRLMQVSGNMVFAYEFDGNATDLSGNGFNGSLGGTMAFTNDDPIGIAANGVLQQSANFTGANWYTISNAAGVLGNLPRTLIMVLNPNISSAVAASTLAYMGGGDGVSSGTFRAFGVGFAGSAAAPALRLDWSRDVNDYTFPARFWGVWIVIAVTHTPGAQRVYAAVLGTDANFTLIGTAARNINTGGFVGNWIAQWNAIRRYIGAMAFIGMKDAVIPLAQLETFLLLPFP